MCCFSTKTTVHGTRIFARLARPGVQLLAYQMTYSAATPTAMILPLPVATPAREDSVRFRSLKGYPQLFDELARAFPELPSFSLSRSKGVSAAAAAAPLEVHEVGDFVASFVPTIADFARLDPRFVIAKDVWDKIPEYRDYGFAVFQLKQLAGAPHPMAFEFDTRLDGALFFPTVHIHDGTVHATDEFDHALYLQSPVLDARVAAYAGPDAVDRDTGYVRSQSAARDFADAGRSAGLLDPDLLLHKTTLRGAHPNRDTFVRLKDLAAAPRGCARCDAGASGGAGLSSASLPIGVAIAGLGWIIRRRDARRGRTR